MFIFHYSLNNGISNQVCGLVVIAALLDVLEPGLKLCSLLLHVLKAGPDLSLDLLAMYEQYLQHVVATVPIVFQQSFELFFCQREGKSDN